MSTGTRSGGEPGAGAASDLGGFLAALSWPEPQLQEFDADGAPGDPVELFAQWLRGAVAAGVPGAHVVTLATVDAAGRPDARVTVLEDVAQSAFWVSASETSPKGKQLARVPVAALVFHWPLLGRQVRVRGTVRIADAQRTADAFARLSVRDRAEVLVDRQSRPLHDEHWLSDSLGDTSEMLQLDEPGPATPPEWRLFGIDAGRMEFFQAVADGHHVRLRYSRDASTSGYARELLRP